VQKIPLDKLKVPILNQPVDLSVVEHKGHLCRVAVYAETEATLSSKLNQVSTNATERVKHICHECLLIDAHLLRIAIIMMYFVYVRPFGQILCNRLRGHRVPGLPVHLDAAIEVGEQKVPFVVETLDLLRLECKKLFITELVFGEREDISCSSLREVRVVFAAVRHHVLDVRELFQGVLNYDNGVFVVLRVYLQAHFADRVLVYGKRVLVLPVLLLHFV